MFNTLYRINGFQFLSVDIQKNSSSSSDCLDKSSSIIYYNKSTSKSPVCLAKLDHILITRSLPQIPSDPYQRDISYKHRSVLNECSIILIIIIYISNLHFYINRLNCIQTAKLFETKTSSDQKEKSLSGTVSKNEKEREISKQAEFSFKDCSKIIPEKSFQRPLRKSLQDPIIIGPVELKNRTRIRGRQKTSENHQSRGFKQKCSFYDSTESSELKLMARRPK